jgi:hypothetical protein
MIEKVFILDVLLVLMDVAWDELEEEIREDIFWGDFGMDKFAQKHAYSYQLFLVHLFFVLPLSSSD